jgi:pyruvate dehydrogenase E2 component (dihydrolipoamide acetyltransferase)
VTINLLLDQAEAVWFLLKQTGVQVTWTDVLIKGVSLSLQKFAQLNAAFAVDGVRLHDGINIRVPVSVPDGVPVPAIRGCRGCLL